MIETIQKPRSKKQARTSALTRESKANQRKWERFWKKTDTVPSAQKYNLTISNLPKFIWFRNAKVGTRSIFTAFENSNVPFTAESPANCYYSPGIYKDYFKFGFVRNPWDRFVSGWLNKVVKNNSLNFDETTHQEMQIFENFVSYCSTLDLGTCNRHFRHQHKLIDLNEIDFLGRMESFNRDLGDVFRILDLPLKKVPLKNKSEHSGNYHSFFTKETKSKIFEMYKKDIQIFGYTYDLDTRGQT